MTKKPSRKVKAQPKAKPAKAGKAVRKPAKATRPVAKAAAKPMLGGKAPGPVGMAARLAAMAAASAEMADPHIMGRAGGAPAPPPGKPAVPAKPMARNTVVVADEDAGAEAPTPPSPKPTGGRGKSIEIPDDPAPVAARPAASPRAPEPSSKLAALAAAAVDDDDDGGVIVASKPTGPVAKVEVDEGVQVVSKKATSISDDLLAELKKAIVVKGSGRIIAGINLDELKFNEESLIPVIAQDRKTGAVLMQAWANKDALEKSLTSREMTYWSRQRNKLWTKGEESGHTQRLVHMAVDCDKDAMLAVVEQVGPACHNDTGTCWTAGKEPPIAGFVGELDRLIATRAHEKPKGSYTVGLLADPKKAAAKVVEEAEELAKVVSGKPNPDTLEHEAADLLYHLLVACQSRGVGLDAILAELVKRAAKHT